MIIVNQTNKMTTEYILTAP